MIKLESNAKNFTIFATSSGLPILFNGVEFTISEIAELSSFAFILVSISPGQIALTHMLLGPNSFARDNVSVFSAPFAAEYMLSMLAPTFPHIEDIFMIFPHFSLIICFATCLIVNTMLLKLVSNI